MDRSGDVAADVTVTINSRLDCPCDKYSGYNLAKEPQPKSHPISLSLPRLGNRLVNRIDGVSARVVRVRWLKRSFTIQIVDSFLSHNGRWIILSDKINDKKRVSENFPTSFIVNTAWCPFFSAFLLMDVQAGLLSAILVEVNQKNEGLACGSPFSSSGLPFYRVLPDVARLGIRLNELLES